MPWKQKRATLCWHQDVSYRQLHGAAIELLVYSEFSALFNRGAASADGQCLRPSIRVRACTESEIWPQSWHLSPPLSMWWELSPCYRHCISDRHTHMKYKRLSQPKAFPNLRHKTGSASKYTHQQYQDMCQDDPTLSSVPGLPPALTSLGPPSLPAAHRGHHQEQQDATPGSFNISILATLPLLQPISDLSEVWSLV